MIMSVGRELRSDFFFIIFRIEWYMWNFVYISSRQHLWILSTSEGVAPGYSE